MFKQSKIQKTNSKRMIIFDFWLLPTYTNPSNHNQHRPPFANSCPSNHTAILQAFQDVRPGPIESRGESKNHLNFRPSLGVGQGGFRRSLLLGEDPFID